MKTVGSLESGEAYTPAVWPLEAGNVLLVAERMFREIISIAQEHGLSTYDASYLDLAMRLGLPLATRDAALMAAAQRSGVPIYAPSAVR